MKESLTSLFIELAEPNNEGKSRLVYKTEFIGDYKNR